MKISLFLLLLISQLAFAQNKETNGYQRGLGFSYIPEGYHYGLRNRLPMLTEGGLDGGKNFFSPGGPIGFSKLINRERNILSLYPDKMPCVIPNQAVIEKMPMAGADHLQSQDPMPNAISHPNTPPVARPK
jgi:hypothetical protein